VITVTTDISNQSQCKVLIDRSIKEYGHIDPLINNAGIGMRAKVDELPDLSTMEKVMRVNFWGCVYCPHFELQYIKATKGRMVTINSGGGKIVTP
jgi:short-subunit dehydrogenase